MEQTYYCDGGGHEGRVEKPQQNREKMRFDCRWRFYLESIRRCGIINGKL